jgi:hypothetical protein
VTPNIGREIGADLPMKARYPSAATETHQRCVCLSLENKHTGDIEMMTVWENEISAEVNSFALRNFIGTDDIGVAMLKVPASFFRDPRAALAANNVNTQVQPTTTLRSTIDRIMLSARSK